MFGPRFCVFLVFASVIFGCFCQEYDFAAEITRQCLVPDPVGLLDCVENKVTLPYLTSWVDCTNSLGQNVRTSADIINYRCKSVWEGKGVIPEVFYIKDCVIEKTGLPAKNVSAEVLGAYKECESTPKPQQQRIKTAPIQPQQLRVSSVEYGPATQQFQSPGIPVPPQSPQIPVQRIQAPMFSQQQNIPPGQLQFTSARPVQPQMQRPQQAPFQSNQPAVPRMQYQIPSSRPQSVPNPVNRQPYSQQCFIMYPQVPASNLQQNPNKPIVPQNPSILPQQQMLASTQQVVSPNAPYSYSFQIRHPTKQ